MILNYRGLNKTCHHHDGGSTVQKNCPEMHNLYAESRNKYVFLMMMMMVFLPLNSHVVSGIQFFVSFLFVFYKYSQCTVSILTLASIRSSCMTFSDIHFFFQFKLIVICYICCCWKLYIK